MVQTADENVSAPPPEQLIKQRKKQAKREAKIMLTIERAKAKVQKAEQKLAKAQGKLEARQARLHQLEEPVSAPQHTAEQA